jgi:hypothetical protein
MTRTGFSVLGWMMVVLVWACALPAAGEVFTPGMAVSNVDYFGQPAFRIDHVRPDGGGSQLYVTLSSPAPQVQITPIDATPAWPTSWYQASYELPFDGPAVESMTPFSNNWGAPESAITVDALTPFYIASWAGDTFGAGQPIIGPDDYYLWGRFQITNDGGVSSLSLLDSAITKVGIYVGTTVAVPEPSTLGLGCAGLLIAGLRRIRVRRSNKRSHT